MVCFIQVFGKKMCCLLFRLGIFGIHACACPFGVNTRVCVCVCTCVCVRVCGVLHPFYCMEGVLSHPFSQVSSRTIYRTVPQMIRSCPVQHWHIIPIVAHRRFHGLKCFEMNTEFPQRIDFMLSKCIILPKPSQYRILLRSGLPFNSNHWKQHSMWLEADLLL